MIWDQPPQADVTDQNQRIEANIGRQPDGLAVACLDQATNVQLLKEAKEAGVNVMTFNSFCSENSPSSARRTATRTATTSASSCSSTSAARARSASSPAA